MVKKSRAFQVTPKWSEHLRVRVMQEMDATTSAFATAQTSKPDTLMHSMVQAESKKVSEARAYSQSATGSPSLMSFFFSHKLFAFSIGVLAIFLVTNESLFAHARYAFAQGNILFGDTAYDKSMASLSYANAQTRRLETDASTVQLAYVEKSILLSQKELDALQLTGESGKYTQEDCLGVYRLYDAKLDNIKEVLQKKLDITKDADMRQRVLHTLVVTNAALAEVDERISLYPAPHKESPAFSNETR